jgi:hypothetical protein
VTASTVNGPPDYKTQQLQTRQASADFTNIALDNTRFPTGRRSPRLVTGLTVSALLYTPTFFARFLNCGWDDGYLRDTGEPLHSFRGLCEGHLPPSSCAPVTMSLVSTHITQFWLVRRQIDDPQPPQPF